MLARLATDFLAPQSIEKGIDLGVNLRRVADE
jgi:hypothetical protein